MLTSTPVMLRQRTLKNNWTSMDLVNSDSRRFEYLWKTKYINALYKKKKSINVIEQILTLLHFDDFLCKWIVFCKLSSHLLVII